MQPYLSGKYSSTTAPYIKAVPPVLESLSICLISMSVLYNIYNNTLPQSQTGTWHKEIGHHWSKQLLRGVRYTDILQAKICGGIERLTLREKAKKKKLNYNLFYWPVCTLFHSCVAERR